MTLAEKKKLQWEKERGTDVNALKKVSEREREIERERYILYANIHSYKEAIIAVEELET